MKNIRRYATLFCFTVILLATAVYWAGKTDVTLPRFVIQSDDESDAKEVSIFDNGKGSYYVFLPSYADLEQVSVSLSSGDRFSLDDVILENGMSCAGFAPETPYAFSINGQKKAILEFLQSENVAAVFIETDSESMEYIHSDQSYSENSAVHLYTPDGKIDYAGKNCTLKGRGNSSWGYDKKPYSLMLSADESLLDMAEAANWVLLANASDETNLNNKLILDLASRVGLAWTPECRWVDLYLNGEYNGLYLLTEKVEVSPNRLNIDADSGDFLCKIDLEERWTTLRNPFLTATGRTVEINHPRTLTDADTDRIKSLVGQLEQAILSGADLRSSQILDLDSLVRRYLIDEISGNIDADSASSYFTYADGVFFAGPVWDYDMALGNCTRNQEAHAFLARNPLTPQATAAPYYRALYANASFAERMKTIYRTEFVPVLQQMLGGEIDQLSAEIRKASQSNSIRWREMFDIVQSWYPFAVRTSDGIIDYLSRRVDFLSSAWIDHEDYCTVQFRPAHTSSSWNISVRKGTRLQTTYLDIVSTVWLDAATGERFDFSQPITKDTILLRQEQEAAPAPYSIGMGDYITFISIAALLIMLAGLIMIDAVHRRKERS